MRIGGVEYDTTPNDEGLPPDMAKVHFRDNVTVTVYAQEEREIIIEVDADDGGETFTPPVKLYLNDAPLFPYATYHGIVRARCEVCGFMTTDVTDLESWNDGTSSGECIRCDTELAVITWWMTDGTVARTHGGPNGHLEHVILVEGEKRG